MHKDASDAARTCIEVLVGAPAGKVDIPVVELQVSVTDGVGKVESNSGTLGMCGKQRKSA